MFAGEPSRHGDRLAALPKRAGLLAAPLWRRAMGAAAAPNGHGAAGTEDDHALESMVDVHAFTPAELERHARGAGFADVRVHGEELLANWFGWFNRTLEATAVQEEIPRAWIQYAYRGYLLLQRVDRALLEPHLPPAGFYNLMLTARQDGVRAEVIDRLEAQPELARHIDPRLDREDVPGLQRLWLPDRR